MVGAIELLVEIIHVNIALISIPPQLSKLDHPQGPGAMDNPTSATFISLNSVSQSDVVTRGRRKA